MFEELRIKSILNKPLDYSKYAKLSSKMKNDSRIIHHLVDSDHMNIIYLPEELQVILLNENPSLIVCFFSKKSSLNKIFDKLDYSKIPITNELLNNLNLNNLKILFEYDYIKYLDACSISSYNANISLLSFICPSNPDEQPDIVLEDGKKQQYLLSVDTERLSRIVLSIGSINEKKKFKKLIQSLPVDKQLELYDKCDALLEYISEEAKNERLYKLIDDNIFDIPASKHELFFKKYPHLICLGSIEDMIRLKDNGHIKSITDVLLLPNAYYEIGKLSDYYKENHNIDELMEIARSNVELFYKITSFNKNYSDADIKKYLNERNNSVISNALKYLSKDAKNSNDKYYQGLKILLDKKIIDKNKEEDIYEYLSTYNQSLLVKLLTNAYGQHVNTLFEKRPQLDIVYFQSFEILDNKILDNLGPGFIDYYTSYNFNRYNFLIHKLINSDKYLKTFSKYFDFYTKRIKPFNLNDFSNLLERFMYVKPLFDKLDMDYLSEDEQNSIVVMFNDDINILPYVFSPNDLTNYMAIRSKVLFNKYSSQTQDSNGRNMGLKPFDKQNIIFQLLSGRSTLEDGTLENVNLIQLIDIFNVERITKDQSLINSIGLNSDEVALLLLLNRITYITNENVLNDLMNYFLTADINPYLFIDVFNKIKKYYTKDLLKNMTDLTKEGKTSTVSGIKVVSFDLNDRYNLLCSVYGLNVSGMSSVSVTDPKEIVKDWFTRENGANEISTYIESDSLYSFGNVLRTMQLSNARSKNSYFEKDETASYEKNKRPIFVFDSDVDIIGMGGEDISATLSNRSIKNGFKYIGSKKLKFTSLNELKSSSEDLKRNLYKFPTEIAINRRVHDGSLVSKRVAPCGMIVYEEPTQRDLQIAKAFNDYYKQNGIEKEFVIVKVIPKHANIIEHVPQVKNDVQRPTQEWFRNASEIINKGVR